MDTVYVVERWFDPYTYEGIFGIFAAKGLAQMALDEQLKVEADTGEGYVYQIRKFTVGQYEIG